MERSIHDAPPAAGVATAAEDVRPACVPNRSSATACVKLEPCESLNAAVARAGLHTGHEVWDDPVCLEQTMPQVPVKIEPVNEGTVSRKRKLLQVKLEPSSESSVPACESRATDCVKPEPCEGVSAAAARAGLYAGHEVRGELVLGPVCVEQRPQVVKLAGAGAARVLRERGSGTAGSGESENEQQGAGAGAGAGRAAAAAARRRPRGAGCPHRAKTKQPKREKAYSKAQLNEAIQEMKHGMSLHEASKKYNVPKATLHDVRRGRYTHAAGGAQPALARAEEAALVGWVHCLGQAGLQLTKNRILDEVAKVVSNLTRPNPFKNGVPGKKWFRSFLKRHPIVSKCVAQSQRNELSRVAVRAWFGRLQNYLTARDLLHVFRDPSRIFNCDEIGFFLCPKEEVLVRRGSDVVYNRVEGDEKECLSVFVNVSADGKMAPPMTIFPDKTVPRKVVSTIPQGWGWHGTETGWMTAEAFYEYVTECFHPWLVTNQVPLPVVLFLDHTAHISVALSEFCREKAIILRALLPNSAHVLQPLAAAVHAPLAAAWPAAAATATAVRGVGAQNNSAALKRVDFALAVKTCFGCLIPETIRSGFRSCGLYPFDPSSVNYSIIHDTEDIDEWPSSENFKNYFKAKPSPVSQTVIDLGDRTNSESDEKLSDSVRNPDSDPLAGSLVTQDSPSPQEPPPQESPRLCREILHVPEMVADTSRGNCHVCLRNDVKRKVALMCSACDEFLCPGECWRQWHSLQHLLGRQLASRKKQRRGINCRLSRGSKMNQE